MSTPSPVDLDLALLVPLARSLNASGLSSFCFLSLTYNTREKSRAMDIDDMLLGLAEGTAHNPPSKGGGGTGGGGGGAGQKKRKRPVHDEISDESACVPLSLARALGGVMGGSRGARKR